MSTQTKLKIFTPFFYYYIKVTQLLGLESCTYIRLTLKSLNYNVHTNINL